MTVIVMIGGSDATDRYALAHGAAIARRTDSVLEAHSALPDPTEAAIYAASPDAISVGMVASAGVRDAQDELVNRWQSMFDSVMADSGRGVSATYTHVTAPTRRYAIDAGLLADPVVFPRGATHSRHLLSEAFADLLMDARLPILLAGSREDPGDGPALVAWDGSAQAARAVRAIS